MKTIQEITKERAEVMQHFANGGEVEALYLDSPTMTWFSSESPDWDWVDFDYRKKEPVKQKIKMLCWLGSDTMLWIKEGAWTSNEWIRVPSEDKEIEV